MNDPEELVWMTEPANKLWALDELILARHLNYKCGPVGLDVPEPNWYIVRPCVNLLGGGMGAQKVWIEKETDNLPLGFFWCEFFEGNHYSVDYKFGKPILTVEGFKKEDTFIKWSRWIKTDNHIPLPNQLKEFSNRKILNVEYIGDKPIELHYRDNADFKFNNNEFLPVWEGEDTTPPNGYTFVECSGIQGRLGGFIRV
jgi:hypothetical protein